ncbi:hypothetical protein LTR94_037176, partial [Friedmanniomyces endolithicus]
PLRLSVVRRDQGQSGHRHRLCHPAQRPASRVHASRGRRGKACDVREADGQYGGRGPGDGRRLPGRRPQADDRLSQPVRSHEPRGHPH